MEQKLIKWQMIRPYGLAIHFWAQCSALLINNIRRVHSLLNPWVRIVLDCPFLLSSFLNFQIFGVHLATYGTSPKGLCKLYKIYNTMLNSDLQN